MTEERTKINRKYKDSVFRMIFREKKELLSLFNAVYGTSFNDPGGLEVVTLENAVYMGLKNDISCILDFHLALLEHQSTYNPNMPLRSLMYVADLYQKLTTELDIYSSRQIMLPNPSFIVLYNGEKEQPEEKFLCLSGAYSWKSEDRALELKVLQLNINKGYNEKIVSRCPALSGYIQFVSRVRELQKTYPIAKAADQAVQECIRDGILEEFFRKNRAEVWKMSIYEYDEEKHHRTLREEGREGGRKESICRMLDRQKTPEEIREFTGEPLEYLYEVQKEYLAMVKEEGRYTLGK